MGASNLSSPELANGVPGDPVYGLPAKLRLTLQTWELNCWRFAVDYHEPSVTRDYSHGRIFLSHT